MKLICLLLFFSLLGSNVACAQKTYSIHSLMTASLDKRMKIGGKYGYYQYSRERFGGGKILLEKGTYSIWIGEHGGEPDVSMFILKTEIKPEYTTYSSRNSELVVFKARTVGDRKVTQIHFNRGYDHILKLFEIKGIFEVSTALTGAEAVAARNEQTKRDRIAAKEEALRVEAENIAVAKRRAEQRVTDSLTLLRYSLEAAH